jgi:hypothetical protein
VSVRWHAHMKPGPSRIYVRMLRGKVTPERYAAVLKRAVGMGPLPLPPITNADPGDENDYPA